MGPRIPPATLAALRDDRAVRDILVANAVTLAMAWWADEGLLLLLWPYWFQSVVIGFFAQRRMRLLRRFRADGVRMNGHPLEATPEAARRSANFFVLHYGLFHLVHAFFLAVFTAIAASGDAGTAAEAPIPAIAGRFGSMELLYVGVAAVSFLLTHAASHRAHVEADLRGDPHIGTLMFLPYARVLPMHFTLILGAGLGSTAVGLGLFAALKTAADVLMHVVEHRVLQGAPAVA